MPRPILNARLHLVALILVWAGWMFTTGQVLTRLHFLDVIDASSPFRQSAPAAATLLLTMMGWAWITGRFPELARRASTWPVRAVGLAGLCGLAAFFLGVRADSSALPESGLLAARAALGVLIVFLVALAPTISGPEVPGFFLTRRTASDTLARRSLFAAAGHALLSVFALWLVLQAEEGWHGALAYLIGVALSLWQRYPQRAIALIPIGWTIAAIALSAAAIAPMDVRWPVLVACAALGLGHTSPRNDLLANLPDAERARGLMTMALAAVLGGALGAGIIRALTTWDKAPVLIALVLPLAVFAIYGYLRELVEQLVEPPLSLSYRIRGYGPGLKSLPTRGPVLVYANHCAWLDPMWVAKLVPLRLKPMMTSKFYDKPQIRWLMRHVFHTIRVPDSVFRREAPEIQEAIAALNRGENVLIFPEGWLKRKEEQSMRRFGQGIYQILREKPGTPIVACWIEGGWGSYMSYKGGPPTVNKKPDFLRPIRIGISEPEVLSLDLLHDGLATRRHLMLKCLHARTYLGLPELPPPPFAQAEESDEGGENRD
jgi:1-acyl-sn-glycerol-3-phosphate acyltransferase